MKVHFGRIFTRKKGDDYKYSERGCYGFMHKNLGFCFALRASWCKFAANKQNQ